MTIDKIKSEMKAYTDLYGGDLLGIGDIDSAKTLLDLERIIENHRTHMEMMLCDANSSLDRLKKKLGLF